MSNLLSSKEYELVTNSVPIVCIDVIPLIYSNNTVKLGAIIRATGSESGKVALIGGRILKNESITEAIRRHIQKDLSCTQFSYNQLNNEDSPFLVQQYEHTASLPKKFECFDPTKHSIGLTYLIELQETPVATNEARDFLWLSEHDINDNFAFRQDFVFKQVIKNLKNNYLP